VDGTIDLLFGRCPSVVFVVKSTTIVVNTDTEFRKGTCNDLQSGANVSVTGTQNDRNILATRVEFRDKPHD